MLGKQPNGYNSVSGHGATSAGQGRECLTFRLHVRLIRSEGSVYVSATSPKPSALPVFSRQADGRLTATSTAQPGGHSTRSIEEFVDVLRAGHVQRVVDVRSIPRSRTNPAYNLETLPETLSRWQIRHTIIPALGGRRSRQKEVDPQVNAYWDNQSFQQLRRPRDVRGIQGRAGRADRIRR